MAEEIKNKTTSTVTPAEESLETVDFEQSSEQNWEKYQVNNPNMIGGGMTMTDEPHYDNLMSMGSDNSDIALGEQDDVSEFIESGDKAVDDYYKNTPDGQAVMQKREANKKKLSELNYYDQSKKISIFLSGLEYLPVGALKLAGTPMGYWLGKVAFVTNHDLVRSTLQFGAEVSNEAFSAIEGLLNWVNETESKLDEKLYGIKKEPENMEVARVPRVEGDLIPEEWRTPSVEFASNTLEFLVPMVVGGAYVGAYKGIQGATKLKKAINLAKMTAKEAGLAGGVGMVVLNPDEDNIANFFQKYKFLRNPIFEALARDEDDSRVEARMKNAILEAGIDIPFGLGVRGAMAIYRALKFRSSVETQILKEQLEGKGISRADDIMDSVDFTAVHKVVELPATASKGEVANKKMMELADQIDMEAKAKGADSKPIEKKRIEPTGQNVIKFYPADQLKKDIRGIANGGMIDNVLMPWEYFEFTFQKIGASVEQGQKMLELGAWKQRFINFMKEMITELDHTLDRAKAAGSRIQKGKYYSDQNYYHDLWQFEKVKPKEEVLDKINDFFNQVEKNQIINPNHEVFKLELPSPLESLSKEQAAFKKSFNEAGFINFGFFKALKNIMDKQKWLSFKEAEIYKNIKKITDNPKVEPFADPAPMQPSQNITDYAMNEMPPSGFQKQGKGPGPVIIGEPLERVGFTKRLIRKLQRQPQEYAQKEILPKAEFDLQVGGIRESVLNYIKKSPYFDNKSFKQAEKSKSLKPISLKDDIEFVQSRFNEITERHLRNGIHGSMNYETFGKDLEEILNFNKNVLKDRKLYEKFANTIQGGDFVSKMGGYQEQMIWKLLKEEGYIKNSVDIHRIKLGDASDPVFMKDKKFHFKWDEKRNGVFKSKTIDLNTSKYNPPVTVKPITNTPLDIFNKIANKYHALGWKLPMDRLPTLSSDQFINNMDVWFDQIPKDSGFNLVKELEDAIDKAFNIQMPTQALDETALHIRKLADRIAVTQQPHRAIKLSQEEAHALTSQKRSQLDAMMVDIDQSIIADQRKSPERAEKFRKSARTRLEGYLFDLQSEEPLLDTAGRILKSKDVGIDVSTKDLLPGQRTTIRDYRYLNKILGEANSTDEILEALYDAKRTGKDMITAINRAGVLSYEKPLGFMGKINDWSRTVQTLVGLRMLSALSTKYVVASGLGQMNMLKGLSNILEDVVFDPMVRGFREMKGVPQMSKSRTLTRLYLWKQEMAEASKNAWDYLSFQKNSVELDFSPKTGSPQDLRYEMTKGESPLQHFREWGLNVLNPQTTNKAMKGFRFLFNRAMQTYQLVGGIRIIKGMDIFNRNLNLPIALSNVLQDKWNRRNVIRKKQNLRPYSKGELEDKFFQDYLNLYVAAQKGEGGALKEIQSAYDETNRMSFMSRNVKIAGSENINFGDMGRKITNQLDKIPFFGKFISLFRHVMLNVGDFVSRSSPLAFVNPDVRKAWGQGRQAQVLGEATAGGLIAAGNVALFLKGKEIFMPKNKKERQALRQLTGRYAYGPLIRDPEGGKQYVLDTGDPVGAVTGYYMELYDILDDIDSSELGDFAQFFGDLSRHHLTVFSPYELIEKYAVLSALGEGEGKAAYKMAKLIKNGFHSGIIKEIGRWKSGFHPQEDVAQMEGELDENYNRNDKKFPIRWNLLMRKAVPMWGEERDIGVPQTDFLGHDLTLNHPMPRKGFSVVSVKDYYDLNRDRGLGKKVIDYANIVRKKLPVRNEPLVMELWKLQDSPSRGKYFDQQMLQLYADYNFSAKDILKQDAFNEILTDQKIKKYFDTVNVNEQQLWDKMYNKRFIINDDGVRNINKLAGGLAEVELGERKTTGNKEINRFLSNFRKETNNYEALQEVMNSPEMEQNQQRMLSWAMNFDKYGSDLMTALERLVFNPQEGRVKMEFEASIKGKELTLTEKKQVLAVLMRKRFKPYGFKSKGLAKALAIKVDETDGRYVFNKIIHDHLTVDGKEQNLYFQRGIVNELTKQYTSFAKWTYLQENLFKNKEFKDNLLKEAIRDFEDNTEGFTKSPTGEPVIMQGVGF